MIVVIQCAGSKREHAGSMKTEDGKRVSFVAHPDLAKPARDYVFARPDDVSPSGKTWRDRLLAYNAKPGNNPLALLPAFELYQNQIYRDLAKRFGVGKTYVLSAGWGLIRADFLTPAYDITFSTQADAYVRRRKRDAYCDFSMIPSETDEPIVCFSSKEYVPLFSYLTRQIEAPKIVFYNSSRLAGAPGCRLVKFETRTRTNWQYECATAFLRGTISLES